MKGYLTMTLLEQTLLVQLEEKEKQEQDWIALLKRLLMEYDSLNSELVKLQTQLTNHTSSLFQELENLRTQLASLQKESKNQTFLQEKYRMQLENLKRSLENMD